MKTESQKSRAGEKVYSLNDSYYFFKNINCIKMLAEKKNSDNACLYTIDL